MTMMFPLATDPPVPPALEDPSAVWVFDWLIPIAGTIIIVLAIADTVRRRRLTWGFRSEEHTSELQSLMRISYAVFCLKKKNTNKPHIIYRHYSSTHQFT